MSKLCNICKETKEAKDFHKRKASLDGLAHRCKACQSIYDKKRANAPHRVQMRKEYAVSASGKIAASRAKKRWAEKNAVKRAANIIVGNAIRDGRLIKLPCEICGNDLVHGHHDDYSKPLDVRWLCPPHHKQWHIENGEGKNAF